MGSWGHRATTASSRRPGLWLEKTLCDRADPQEYFAEVDEDYILDRFNLTGLNSDVVQEYNRALDLITDSLGQLFFECEART